MKNIYITSTLFLLFCFTSCETSEDISRSFDYEVPEGTSLTISSIDQSIEVPDSIITKLLWGIVPQKNLDTITIPTLTVTPGSTVNISIEISDNEALGTAELSYSSWLYSKYINFANPEEGIPTTPQNYSFTAQIVIPDDAVTSPWLETFYYNDGSSISYKLSYHEITLTLVDINMNTRSIPIFLKVEYN